MTTCSTFANFFPLYRYTSSLLVVDGGCVVDVIVVLHMFIYACVLLA